MVDYFQTHLSVESSWNCSANSAHLEEGTRRQETRRQPWEKGEDVEGPVRKVQEAEKPARSHALTSFHNSVQFSSVTQSCPTLFDPMNHSTLGLPVHHKLPEFTQTHVHWVGDAIHSSHPLSSPSPPAANPSQHQGLFQWVNSSHEVAKVLEFQLQHQPFQWTPRTDLL